MTALYTKEMRKTHTILLPEMMEYHFDLIAAAFHNCKYKMEVLDYKNPDIKEIGLLYCNNDMCLPCILITGQLISALKHGIYDPKTTAFLIPQAGGACRAPNYYYVIKKALDKSGFSEVPVISLNLSGKEKHKGFKLSLRLGYSLIAAALYGDLLQALYLNIRASEQTAGECDSLYSRWNKKLSGDIANNKNIKKRRIKKIVGEIIDDFSKIETKEISDNKIGVVGEIYIKSCKLGNNNLEDFLKKNNANYFMSGFTTYCLYVADTSVSEFLAQHHLKIFSFVRGIIMHYLNKKQSLISKPLKKAGFLFFNYKELRNRGDHILDFKTSTADGWLVSCEMMGLIEKGYKKILIALPFGCMVSHVCSKGIIRRINEKYKDCMVYPIEYDSSMAPIVAENRILLVLQS